MMTINRPSLFLAAAAALSLACWAGGAMAQSAPRACGTLAQDHPELTGKHLVVGFATSAPAPYTMTDATDPTKVIGIEPTLLQAAAGLPRVHL